MISSQLDRDVAFALQAGIWLSAGLLIGAAFFLMLRWNVRLLTPSRLSLAVMALPLARFALLAAALCVVAVRFGGFPLIAATAGIVAARLIAVRMLAPA